RVTRAPAAPFCSFLRLSLVFCCTPLDHRDRPSFPTRRSSDLPAGDDGIPDRGLHPGGAGLVLLSQGRVEPLGEGAAQELLVLEEDRKSTRLNSSHVKISYAVFCLKKKSKPEKRRPGGAQSTGP